MNGIIRVLVAGIVYFVLVFCAGFALGVVRVTWLVERLGERWAELVEMPVMLIAIVMAARFVFSRVPLQRRSHRLPAGGLALALLLVVELTVVLTLRGMRIGEYLETRDPVAGTAYLVMLLVFALMPWWLARPSGRATGRAGNARPARDRR